MTTELKKCPFCGGQAEYINDIYGEGFLDGVCCTSCDAAVFAAYNRKDPKERLIVQWNHRVEDK